MRNMLVQRTNKNSVSRLSVLEKLKNRLNRKFLSNQKGKSRPVISQSSTYQLAEQEVSAEPEPAEPEHQTRDDASEQAKKKSDFLLALWSRQKCVMLD